MSTSPSIAPITATATATATRFERIAELLLMLHPLHKINAAMAHVHPLYRQPFEELNAKFLADQAKFQSMSDQELLELCAVHNARAATQRKQRTAQAAAEKAKKEAARFYNKDSARADFEFWSKLEFWTFDEAIALLLGKDPQVVSWAMMKQELEPAFSLFSRPASRTDLPQFVRQYQKLRLLAERASAMNSRCLRPAEVIAWASLVHACEIPTPLLAMLGTTCSEASREPIEMMPVRGEAPAELALIEVGKEPTGVTSKKWTSEMLQELKAFRERHGTLAAAKKFGITSARIRQLLPKDPPQSKGYGGFSQLLSRRVS